MNTSTPDAQPEEWKQESLAAYLRKNGVGASKTAAVAKSLIDADYTTEAELLAATENDLRRIGVSVPVTRLILTIGQNQQNSKLRCCVCILVFK